ncbi:aldose 1-epimerase [Vibrio sp. B1FLJ16]|uniref:aldose 1-epimerase n=1 Tax=Vibrio sp. B1FLJ16 TaxID=2751178 RepID=UPI0015F4781E|nr:aldose 1-epimerase [Vibrio sp. B1FLJ16]CAD7813055.1 Aldose 1-epimerase [Vibrio sp. B1FLJ16]CAE6920435.1 Aldose 1-epimerase [Vibrio sp. B1FLJ16]
MFKLIKSNFGKFKSTTLINPELGIQVDIIQDFGAIINQYRVNHSPFSFITGYKDSEELIQSHPFFSRSAKLFPFPNRLNAGCYSYNQREYKLAANFPWSEHAVHGLLYNQPFELVAHEVNSEYADATFRFETSKLAEGYPFAFCLDIRYRINNQGVLSCHTTITNSGTEHFPFGDAWHPYFSLGCELEQCQLTMSPHAELKHENDLPTGQFVSSNRFSSPTSLNGVNLNHCYQFSDPSEQTLMLVHEDNSASLHFQQREGYSFVQLYTPPSEPSIAIEPMTCPADAFNNHIGLLELAPGESNQFSWQCQAHFG